MDEIEIPEAIREEIQLPKKSASTFSMPIVSIVGCMVIAGLASMFFLFPKADKSQEPLEQSASQTTEQPKAESSSSSKGNTTIKQPIAKESLQQDQPVRAIQENLLGHLPYNVAPQSSLEAITADGRLRMRSNAAKKFKKMQSDARAEGIILTAISAFRTTQDQEQLFFGVKEQRVQNAAKRAEVSAPPGYSEHHTGYAVDIGDGNAPSTHVEVEFADTPAFAWLEKNALKYSFELSFPPDNDQGVSYEPWHWRFVGDRDSLETFYKVKN